MEQVQQLLEILKQTPEMALWGLGIYFIFILAKLASWIYALKVVSQMFIKRLFDYKEKQLVAKRGSDLASYFEKQSISTNDYTLLLELLSVIKKPDMGYIHSSDIHEAISKIKANK